MSGCVDYEAGWESKRQGDISFHKAESDKWMEEGSSLENWKSTSKLILTLELLHIFLK